MRSCARTKVKNILNTSWSPYYFPIVIREVVNSTKDKELHDILSDVMAAHINELIGLDEDIAPPEVISDFADSILRKLAAATISSENRFVQRVEDLESQLGEAKQQTQLGVRAYEGTSERMEHIENDIQHFRQRLNGTTRCRNYNCNADFSCRMEEGGSHKYILRCTKCRCKHK